MALKLLIEGTNTEQATAELQAVIPTATKLEPEGNTRGLMTVATVIAIFGAVGAGAKMVKDVADMTKSVAELAKLLIEWKQASAKEDKTVLVKDTPDEEQKTLLLKADTESEKLAAFLEE